MLTRQHGDKKSAVIVMIYTKKLDQGQHMFRRLDNLRFYEPAHLSLYVRNTLGSFTLREHFTAPEEGLNWTQLLPCLDFRCWLSFLDINKLLREVKWLDRRSHWLVGAENYSFEDPLGKKCNILVCRGVLLYPGTLKWCIWS